MTDGWSFTIPGSAPSVNHMYLPAATHGKLRKAPGVEAWQTAVALIVRAAKPSGWMPAIQIRVTYDFYLNRHADCDNLQKALNDAIAKALGVDDDCFLPCARSKTAGLPKAEARIVVEITNA